MSVKNIRAVSPSRRQVLSGVGVAMAGLVVASTVGAQDKMVEEQSVGTEGLLTYLHQEIPIQASAHRIYEALLDSKQFATLTGLPAQISRDTGGTISMFNGMIVGRNIELVPDQRIVQAWRPASWAPGVYSLVKFELKEHGPQCMIVLDHTGFPEGNFRHLDSGWYERYWEPLKKFLA